MSVSPTSTKAESVLDETALRLLGKEMLDNLYLVPISVEFSISLPAGAPMTHPHIFRVPNEIPEDIDEVKLTMPDVVVSLIHHQGLDLLVRFLNTSHKAFWIEWKDKNGVYVIRREARLTTITRYVVMDCELKTKTVSGLINAMCFQFLIDDDGAWKTSLCELGAVRQPVYDSASIEVLSQLLARDLLESVCSQPENSWEVKHH